VFPGEFPVGAFVSDGLDGIEGSGEAGLGVDSVGLGVGSRVQSNEGQLPSVDTQLWNRGIRLRKNESSSFDDFSFTLTYSTVSYISAFQGMKME
jgi:hypothetical protein